jgi:N-acetylglucosamine kinase-like BadF-type ATPase
MHPPLVLGVDGGNSKTIALIARADGTILGAGRGGCADLYNAASTDAALAAVDEAVTAALATAGAAPAHLAAGCFSMAGADWPEDFTLLHAAMIERAYGAAVRIVHDSIGGLRAGSSEGTGVAVILGTGTAIGGCAPDGRLWHASFWQESLEWSHHALRAVFRAELGIDPPTSLTERILRQFACSSVEEVLHRLTTRELPLPVPKGQLVRVLLDEAGKGDATARRIVAERGSLAGDYALAVARRISIVETEFALVLGGGIMRHPVPLLSEAIVERVRRDAPGARPVRSRFEPAAGALFLALELAGACVDECVLERVEASMPAPALFAT